jgi:hypothetical protein
MRVVEVAVVGRPQVALRVAVAAVLVLRPI